MSTFTYKLESLLSVREKLEDAKQKEYAEALEVLEQKKDIKNKIDKSLKNSTLVFKASICNQIDTRKIKTQQNHHMLLKQKKGLAKENLKIAEQKTTQQRKELLAAMRSRKTLEILKEKKYEEFLNQEKKDEQQVIDEIVSFTYKQT